MEEKQATEHSPHHAVMEAYLEALKERDAARCVDFYADDGEIHFVSAVFKGKKAIEEWHRDRFAADMEILRVDRVSVDGDTVKVQGMVTSRKLRAWKISKLAGQATFSMRQGKISDASFSVRMYNPLGRR